MTKPASSINSEYDSRILRVSSGPSGIIRPQFTQDGTLQKVYCLSCGAPGGYVTAEVPVFLRGDPGVIYICTPCERSGKIKSLPLDAISLARYREA